MNPPTTVTTGPLDAQGSPSPRSSSLNKRKFPSDPVSGVSERCMAALAVEQPPSSVVSALLSSDPSPRVSPAPVSPKQCSSRSPRFSLSLEKTGPTVPGSPRPGVTTPRSPRPERTLGPGSPTSGQPRSPRSPRFRQTPPKTFTNEATFPPHSPEPVEGKEKAPAEAFASKPPLQTVPPPRKEITAWDLTWDYFFSPKNNTAVFFGKLAMIFFSLGLIWGLVYCNYYIQTNR